MKLSGHEGAGISAAVLYVVAITISAVLARQAKRAAQAAVGLQKKDVILQVGTTYTVGKRGTVKPGEYKVMATDENHKTFNLRVNDYVQEYRHNTTVVLAAGDTITACSANVILR